MHLFAYLRCNDLPWKKTGPEYKVAWRTLKLCSFFLYPEVHKIVNAEPGPLLQTFWLQAMQLTTKYGKDLMNLLVFIMSSWDTRSSKVLGRYFSTLQIILCIKLLNLITDRQLPRKINSFTVRFHFISVKQTAQQSQHCCFNPKSEEVRFSDYVFDVFVLGGKSNICTVHKCYLYSVGIFMRSGCCAWPPVTVDSYWSCGCESANYGGRQIAVMSNTSCNSNLSN